VQADEFIVRTRRHGTARQKEWHVKPLAPLAYRHPNLFIHREYSPNSKHDKIQIQPIILLILQQHRMRLRQIRPKRLGEEELLVLDLCRKPREKLDGVVECDRVISVIWTYNNER
jgi:hypothetical protein